MGVDDGGDDVEDGDIIVDNASDDTGDVSSDAHAHVSVDHSCRLEGATNVARNVATHSLRRLVRDPAQLRLLTSLYHNVGTGVLDCSLFGHWNVVASTQVFNQGLGFIMNKNMTNRFSHEKKSEPARAHLVPVS